MSEKQDVQTLEEAVRKALDDTRTSTETQTIIAEELAELRTVTEQDYHHSLKVGLYSQAIAQQLGLDERALLIAGLLHDIGKKNLPPELFRKKNWTDDDRKVMEQHVEETYNILIRRQLSFTAEIALRHHQRQEHPYPEILPPFLHYYCHETKKLITHLSEILAIADTYDAYHRVNGRNGHVPLTEEDIKEKMLAHHAHQQDTITKLYNEGILGSGINGALKRYESNASTSLPTQQPV